MEKKIKISIRKLEARLRRRPCLEDYQWGRKVFDKYIEDFQKSFAVSFEEAREIALEAMSLPLSTDTRPL